MRGVLNLILGLLAALGLAGCDTTDSRYFRYGIGTNLYSDDIVQTTQFQDVYLTELCRQAMPVVSTNEAQCVGLAPTPPTWNLIVQAGMNDVDRRCDSYLAWLDDRRRTNSAVLKELGDAAVAAQGIMRVTGVGANPITLAGLAFGFAANTFTNVNSRLLLEVDKTTVQTLVLRRRDQFRFDMARKVITDRPTAVYALRQYLTICTPFAIETEINTTVTVFQQAGGAVLDRTPALINSETVALRTTAPYTPDTRVDGPRQTGEIKPADIYKGYLESFNPKADSMSYVEGVLAALCVPKSDYLKPAQVTARIVAFEKWFDQDDPSKITGRLGRGEIIELNRYGACPAEYRNAYERRELASDGQRKEFAEFLSRVSDGGPVTSTRLSDMRSKIKAVRRSLRMEDPVIPDQATPDLLDRLQELRKP
ncbi:hypothetical protein LPW26_22435 [Rhodopseudomonas sp. HC1]|uniref:hypothetical protein n=1 Tax=Rhodopseudomonas infernalis TaxID=2897386 RepID=UPI001EE8388C|nr:hypothetical protein [Rhodopseudomonas infernalis]MCG6207415.1 hypothetical protein [Rhodopseudomonas infernalis]